MSEIINRVKSSSLVTIDINEFYIFGDREVLDISVFLDSGILREKKFRELLAAKKIHLDCQTQKIDIIR